jgi:hydrogenase maturation protease
VTRTVILGVGNLLLSDEGVGIHAAQRLMEDEELRELGVEVLDGGTLGLDLLPIIESCDRLFIVDCVKGGEEPGTVYRFEPEDIKDVVDGIKMSIHDFNLVDVLNLAKALGKPLPKITIYGVEPESLSWSLELTPRVEQALVRVIEELKKEVRAEARSVPPASA